MCVKGAMIVAFLSDTPTGNRKATAAHSPEMCEV